MINNNEEWKEIEISEQNKKADIIDKRKSAKEQFLSIK